MSQYIVKRLLFSLLVLFAISIVVFSAVRLIPGDVCAIVLATPDVDEQQCDAIRDELGLNKPVATQYFVYMGDLVRGDWGTTLISKRDVWGEIRTRIPLTIELTVLSTVFALLIAIPVGVISAARGCSRRLPHLRQRPSSRSRAGRSRSRSRRHRRAWTRTPRPASSTRT